jgi:hypothetical protein
MKIVTALETDERNSAHDSDMSDPGETNQFFEIQFSYS